MDDESHAFLGELFRGKPVETLIQVWTQGDKQTQYFEEVDAAAAHAQEKRKDVYVGVSLAPKGLSRATRAGNSNSAGIVGLWADIDVNGGPSDKRGGAPNLDAATELAFAVAEPTLMVNSGYGLHAWWLFEEPWAFGGAGERERAYEASMGWLALLLKEARSRGFAIDKVQDLARVLRVPGTVNGKGRTEVPVTLLEHDGPRHESSELARLALVNGHARAPTTPRPVGPLAVGAGRELRGSQLAMLCGADADLDSLMRGTNRRIDFSNQSSVDMAIANLGAAAGLDDQTTVDLMITSRLTNRIHPEKVDRLAYYEKTLGKVGAYRAREHAREEQDELREEARERLEEVAHGDDAKVAPELVLPDFSRLIEGPEIKEFIQTGEHHTTATFVLKLGNGEEITFSSVGELTDFKSFRHAWFVRTSTWPKSQTQKQWDTLMQALAKVVVVVPSPEEDPGEKMKNLVLTYMNDRGTADRDGACEIGEPFDHDFGEGMTANVYLPELSRWIGRRMERMDDRRIRSALLSAGFVKKSTTYTTAEGRKTSRQYYRLPRSDLGS